MLPRRSKTQRCFKVGNAAAEYPRTCIGRSTMKNLFVTSTTDRFDQPGFVQCRAASFRGLRYDYQNELDAVCPFYKGDVEQHELSAQHLWNSYEESYYINTYLEVCLTSNLSWKSQIHQICKKVRKQAGIIYKNFSSSSTPKQLYITHIWSTLHPFGIHTALLTLTPSKVYRELQCAFYTA